MPLASPAGPISHAADRLRLTLEACAAFAELSATVHMGQLPPPASGTEHPLDELVALRPFALLWTTDTGYKTTRDTTGAVGRAEGELIIRLERNTPAGETPAEAERSWENLLGRIIQSGDNANPGLVELASDVRYLPIDSVAMIEHSRTDPAHLKAIGDAQRAFLLVNWSNG